jgi:ferrous iron transport protein B
MGLPMVLALNMMDEAETRGMQVDIASLSGCFGLRVIPTIATRGEGVTELVKAAGKAHPANMSLAYPDALETFLADHAVLYPAAPISGRALLLLWLGEDEAADHWLRQHLEPQEYAVLLDNRRHLQNASAKPLPAIIQEIRLAFVDQIVESVLVHRTASISHGSQWLAALTTHPVWGLIVLAMVLFGMYQFVGVFGAGTLVGLLEEGLFGQVLNPWVVQTVERIIPWQLAVDFLVGEYGVWTMGFTYAAALLLPIVSTFFFTFGVLEDSGYLPRLSILSNRLFTKLGLNGKAVLPMVLGLGCVTMATLTTRILDNKRDRMLVTLLLALAIPCSAQLGVVMGMLAGISFGAVIIWSGVMAAILFTVGWLAARLMPGERTPLLVELPPLRWPVLSNVLLKTLVRLEWYIKEAVPLFFLGTILLFTLDKLNVLPWIIKASEPLVVNWLGLPPETSAAFLIGFLRRDFAATGLFAMQSAGALTPLQVVVAIVTITLFIPCIASVFVIAKERGARSAIAMTALIFPLAFLTGGLLQRLLVWIGWGL